jgi:hypothetical protein
LNKLRLAVDGFQPPQKGHRCQAMHASQVADGYFNLSSRTVLLKENDNKKLKLNNLALHKGDC